MEKPLAIKLREAGKKVIGIGKETARLCYKLGAKVLLLDMNEIGLNSLKNELGDRAYVERIDLVELDSIKSVLLNAKKTMGSHHR